MAEEELKKKIVEIIINAIWKDAEADYDSTDETEAGSIAEALIAAGIGDVKEAEHRAEVAERSLELMARGECTFASPEYYKEQAEKELAEERNERNKDISCNE